MSTIVPMMQFRLLIFAVTFLYFLCILTSYQTTKIWTGRIESICRRKKNVIEKLKFVLERVENIVGKRENAVYQHFLLFPTMFSKGFFFKVFKSRDYVEKNKCFSSGEGEQNFFLQILLKRVTLCLTMTTFDAYDENTFFFLFPQCFLHCVR